MQKTFAEETWIPFLFFITPDLQSLYLSFLFRMSCIDFSSSWFESSNWCIREFFLRHSFKALFLCLQMCGDFLLFFACNSNNNIIRLCYLDNVLLDFSSNGLVHSYIRDNTTTRTTQHGKIRAIPQHTTALSYIENSELLNTNYWKQTHAVLNVII